MKKEKEIIVIGHKSPDSDSICSAVAYAQLKRQMDGGNYVARRAGDINKETAFVLDYFGVEEPDYQSDVRTRVSDIEFEVVPSVDRNMSIREAYLTMKEHNSTTLCITNEDNLISGVITMTDIAGANLDVLDNQLVSKAKEYLAILQLGEEYGNIARKVDRENNIATVIFQRVVDEELELYSDYEAVKMLLSAQTGELMSCKIFDLPLVEQEGQMIGQNEAIASVQDQLSLTFEQKAKAELSICSPIAWGDDANFTSRIVWNVTADGVIYYVDAYSGDVLGSRTLEA